MKFSLTVLRSATVAVLAALLASCGGESLVAFVPGRILAFGDQSSVITADGRKYTINASTPAAPDTVDCTVYPIWTQVLATSYGLAFPGCPGTTTGTPTSRILARPAATAGGADEKDLTAQVDRQLALPVEDGGGITPTDLVTVLIGVNDVVAAYERFQAGASQAEVVAQVEAAGVNVVTQVARIVTAGGKVIMSTVPDVSVTPYGRAQDAAGTLLLSFLTERLNLSMLNQLQNSGNNNGRMIGLIELNPYLLNVIAYPTAYGYVNARDAACVPLDPVNCTTNTLVDNTVIGATGLVTWLWASALQMSPTAHAQLGSLASSRAHNQPF